ncbi:MAG: uroporphyrinogen decarboxylase family protein [Promethearchaeota archaeon]
MNSTERFLAVFSENERKKLDRIPTFVQYVRDEFIKINEEKFQILDKNDITLNYYFKAPLLLGFDAIFFPSFPAVKFKPIKIKDKEGRLVKIGIDGQKVFKKSEYYEGGHVDSLDTLQKLKNNWIKIKDSKMLNKFLKACETSIWKYIYTVLTVDGIFDRTWRAMGFTNFSKNFHANTKLYAETVNYFYELTKMDLNLIINSNLKRGNVVAILDDVAYKGRSMISPERWREDFFPFYKKLNAMLRDAGLIPIIHTDGDVTDLISLFREAGFVGLQGWEGGCDPFYVSKNFPDFVVIGFGDVSQVLPYGNYSEIKQHVKMLMNAFKKSRHFMIGPSTVIHEKIPFKNIRIFMRLALKYGKYSSNGL